MITVRLVSAVAFLCLFASPLSGQDEAAKYISQLETIVAMATRAADETEGTIAMIQKVEPSNIDDSNYSRLVKEFREVIAMLPKQIELLKQHPNEPIWIITTLGSLHVLDPKADNIRNAALVQINLLEEWHKAPLRRRMLSTLKGRFDALGELVWDVLPLALAAGDEADRAKEAKHRRELDACIAQLESKKK